MQTLVHQDTHFVFDSLLISMSNVSGDVIQFRLRSMFQAAALSMFCRGWTLAVLTLDTVTVVHPTRNDREYHGCGSILRE